MSLHLNSFWLVMQLFAAGHGLQFPSANQENHERFFVFDVSKSQLNGRFRARSFHVSIHAPCARVTSVPGRAAGAGRSRSTNTNTEGNMTSVRRVADTKPPM